VAAKRYEDTGFTRAVFRGAHYRGANVTNDLINETLAALTKSPSFVYLYVNDLDSAGHSDGVGSDKWIAALSNIDLMVAALIAKLPKGVRFWITADHGMINVGEKIILGQDNNLMENVTLVGGEPRARHIYLREGATAETVASWREFLGSKADVFSRDEVIAAIGTKNIVDVRSPAEFSGELAAPAHLPQEGGQIKGHIPTAKNIPWSKAANEDGTFKSDAELKEIYQSAGVDLGKDTIAYCRIGERSAFSWFVLHELLGVNNVKNYDGSWTEYGSLVGVPVAVGA
jgi:rhodanese-related sulfurtransferase